MTVRALVTGAGGFVGQWLCRALLRDGWQVAGLSLEGVPAGGILTDAERRAVRWESADLGSDASQAAIAREIDQRPDAIFHLAGIAFLPTAANDEPRAVSVNVDGARRILEAGSRAHARGIADPLILIVGSGEQYGAHPDEAMPLAETAACSPLTVYGATKLAQERLALEFARRAPLRIIATRSFNHSGLGHGASFLLPSLVARAKIAQSTGGEVTIGNTDTIRDFLHVEDVVAAYISLVSRGTPGEVYNVCSGLGVRVGELAQEVLTAAGVQLPLKVDPALQRAVDVPVLVGDNTKLRAATGWTPQYSRSRIISDLLDAAP